MLDALYSDMTDAHKQMLSVLRKLKDCKKAVMQGSIFIKKEDKKAITIALEHLVDYFKELSEDMNIHGDEEALISSSKNSDREEL